MSTYADRLWRIAKWRFLGAFFVGCIWVGVLAESYRDRRVAEQVIERLHQEKLIKEPK